VLNQILGLCQLLKIRRARNTALQQSRRRHAGVQYGESGEVGDWDGEGEGKTERTEKGLDLFFASQPFRKRLGTSGEGTVSISWVERHSTVERVCRERPERLRITYARVMSKGLLGARVSLPSRYHVIVRLGRMERLDSSGVFHDD
jgi:hypothetical protein